VSARSACLPREPRNTWASALTLDEPRVSSWLTERTSTRGSMIIPAQAAADKAINRWLKAGRIVKKEGGVCEFGNG
jgi:hypothetical protein